MILANTAAFTKFVKFFKNMKNYNNECGKEIAFIFSGILKHIKFIIFFAFELFIISQGPCFSEQMSKLNLMRKL